MSNPKSRRLGLWISISDVTDPKQIEYIQRQTRMIYGCEGVEQVFQFSRPFCRQPEFYYEPEWLYRRLGLFPPFMAKIRYKGELCTFIRVDGTTLEFLDHCPILQMQLMMEDYDSSVRRLKLADFAIPQWMLFNILARVQLNYAFSTHFQHMIEGEGQLVRQVEEYVDKWVQDLKAQSGKSRLFAYVPTAFADLREEFHEWIHTKFLKVVRPFGHVPARPLKPQQVTYRTQVQTLNGPEPLIVTIDMLFHGVYIDRAQKEIKKLVWNRISQYLDAQYFYPVILRWQDFTKEQLLCNQHVLQLVSCQARSAHRQTKYLDSVVLYYPYDDVTRQIAISTTNIGSAMSRVALRVYWLMQQALINQGLDMPVSQGTQCKFCPIEAQCLIPVHGAMTDKVGDFGGLRQQKLVPAQSSRGLKEELSGTGNPAGEEHVRAEQDAEDSSTLQS